MSMLIGLHLWLKRKFRAAGPMATPLTRKGFKPRLEALEDRVVPTTIKVAVVEDNSGHNSGYVAVANQLNHDTEFHFSATVVTAAQVATVAQLNAYNVVVCGGSGLDSSGASYDTYGAALRTWVLEGHAVVMTGWGEYSTQYVTPTIKSDLNAILPIQIGVNYSYTSPGTITPNGTASPVTAGITPFVDNTGYMELPAAGLEPGATVLATSSSAGNPAAVIVRQPGQGRSVYLGELFTADTSSYGNSGLRTGEADKLLEQAIAWGSEATPPPPAVNPARLRWGHG